MTLKPLQQRPEFIPVLVTSSAAAATYTVDADDNLPAGVYNLALITTESNTDTASDIRLKLFLNEAQTSKSPALYGISLSTSVAATVVTLVTTGDYVVYSAVKADTALASFAGQPIFIPYGLEVTVDSASATSFEATLLAQRRL